MSAYTGRPLHERYEESRTLVNEGTNFGAGRNRITQISSPDFVSGKEDIHDQQDDLLDRLAGHYSPFKGYDLLVKAFEKTTRGNIRASFKDGIRLAEIVDDAIKPKIGITFLAGADAPQVTQMEQIRMSRLKPDQKDASWRVNTAGALLMNFEVDRSMSILVTDNTAAVVTSARQRGISTGPFLDPSLPSSQKALVLRQPAERIVTIDSENVKIVNVLSSEKWDLEGLLIEVDQSSLMAVILNYRQIIQRGGANLPCGETVSSIPLFTGVSSFLVLIEDAA